MSETSPVQASWSVVATVRAGLEVCDLFARHYLARGARQVFLFHDDPAMACEVRRDGVTNTVCDDRWWRKGRPEALEDRQVHNATKAKAMCGTDWILHCDIDELIWSAGDISEVLGAVPGNVGGVVTSTAEAVYTYAPTRDGIFRTPFFKFFINEKGRPRVYQEIADRAYGDISTATKTGFFGHIVGKSFIRTAVPIGRMPLHKKRQEEIKGFLMRHQVNQLVLRHYDTLSPELWKEKHMRRIRGEVSVPLAGRFRERQQQLIMEAARQDGEAGLDRLYLRMSTLPPDILADCVAQGFVRVIRPEPHLLAQAAS